MHLGHSNERRFVLRTEVHHSALQIRPVAVNSLAREQLVIGSKQFHESLYAVTQIFDLSSNDAVDHTADDVVLLEGTAGIVVIPHCDHLPAVLDFANEVRTDLLEQVDLAVDRVLCGKVADCCYRFREALAVGVRIEVVSVDLK